MNCGGILGELNHPDDRIETDLTKVAICMSERPTKNKDGKLMGKFDILDTPNGRIVKALADYGYALGISSRGGGDTYIREGKEYVDEDTYDFEAFDIVLLPAVKDARLRLVTESKKQSLREDINKILEKSDSEEKKVLVETIKGLDLPELEALVESEEVEEVNMEAESAGSTLLNDLQEAIELKAKVEEENVTLLEKVSAGITRETKLNEEIERLKVTIRGLSARAQQAEAKNKMLESKQNAESSAEKQLKEENLMLKAKVKKLEESRESRLSHLTEALNDKSVEASQNKHLVEKLEESNKAYKEKNTKLTEKLETMTKTNESIRKDAAIKINSITKKLNESTAQANLMKDELKEAYETFISTVCRQHAFDTQEFRNRLPENYSIKDIKLVAEKMQDYKVRIDSLPFAVNGKISAQVKQGSEPILESRRTYFNPDDNIDRSSILADYRKK